MFRHRGKRRTFTHNLRLASMLSFVAGVVNVVGVMQLYVLTTNVTGHFAFMAEGVMAGDYTSSLSLVLYVGSFLFGAFCSSLLIELFHRTSVISTYIFPILLEIICLAFVSYGDTWSLHPKLLASTLLFGMGLQNALVTRVSNSVVRTTHLTGLFTDLGIELSLFIFRKRHQNSLAKLKQNINLKCVIILFFFLGSICGGLIVPLFRLKTLFLAIGCLIIALTYDYFKLSFVHMKRKMATQHN